MSDDEQMPAWAKTMETRAEARDHHLLTELSGAITSLRAEMNGYFERVHDDIVVAMQFADQAHRKIDAGARRSQSIAGS